MKSFVLLAIAGLLALVNVPTANAQMIAVTKVTSATTTGGTVLLENTANKDAIALQKGKFYVRTKGYTGGVALFIEHGSGKLIWSGPVSALTITGYATDSLKVLFLRQYLTN